MTQWSGRAVERARKIVVAWLPAECGQCSKPVDVSQPWVVGHKAPRWLRPDLTFVVDNWQPEHRRCSEETSAREAALKAEYLRTGVWPERYAEYEEPELFPIAPTDVEPKLAPSLSPGDALEPNGDTLFSIPDQWGPVKPKPDTFPSTGSLVEPRDELRWSTERVRSYPWLADVADVPTEIAAPPYAMSYPPEEAVCSFAWSGCTHLPDNVPPVIEWIEEEQAGRIKELRWWQRLAILRQAEHDADGALVHETIVESGPRRIGKSIRVSRFALWRMKFGAKVFGEPQVIVHTGSDVAICRQIQKAIWGWAWSQGWTVMKSNGKEAVESPANESEWLIRAQDAVYGYDTTFAIVDEGWDVKPDTVTEGMEPAILERSSPQIHKTSTAHRRATSTMKTAILDALTLFDPTVLLLLWAAPPGSDPGDPAAWKAASPHWSEARAKLIARKYEKALAGERDPEFDDPDPMKGFECQYLNVWPLRARRAVRGFPLLEDTEWAALAAIRPATVPVAAAIEGWSGAGYSVALAWRIRGSERCVVSVEQHAELASAVAAVRASKYRGAVQLGDDLDNDPAVKTLRRTLNRGNASAAVSAIARLLQADDLRHVGDDHLTKQILDALTVDNADGKRLVSAGRADAIKAAAWAVEIARAKPVGGGVTGMVLPSSA